MNTTLFPMLITRFLPRVGRRARDILLVITGSLFVTIMAQVKIPLPFTPVPLTGQTFAVLLVGALFGAQLGAMSLILYIIQGVIGMPVFAGGANGLLYLSGPTGGYLIGFICAAYTIGLLAERGREQHFRSALPVFLAGEVIIYLFGLPWLSLYIGIKNALAAGLFPFLIGDVIKLIVAALVLPATWKLVNPQ